MQGVRSRLRRANRGEKSVQEFPASSCELERLQHPEQDTLAANNGTTRPTPEIRIRGFLDLFFGVNSIFRNSVFVFRRFIWRICRESAKKGRLLWRMSLCKLVESGLSLKAKPTCSKAQSNSKLNNKRWPKIEKKKNIQFDPDSYALNGNTHIFFLSKGNQRCSRKKKWSVFYQ